MTTGASAAVAEGRPAVVMKTWPHGPRSVGRARRLLVHHLDAWGMPHLIDPAQLVLSELVTNSIRHARSPQGHLIATRFERLEHGLRIEVHDANESKPERRGASADAEFGRGLTLVDALTGGQWGVSDRDGPGKMLWAVFDSTDDDNVT